MSNKNKRQAFFNPCLDSSDEDDSLGGKDKKVPLKKTRTNEDFIKNPNDILSDPEELTSVSSDIGDISADEDDENVPSDAEKDPKEECDFGEDVMDGLNLFLV